MPWPLITEADCRARVPHVIVGRSLDDDAVGEAETEAFLTLRLDASSMVLSRLTGIYAVDTIRSMTAEAMPYELKRVALDAFEALLCKRTPEVFPGHDWQAMLDRVDKDLTALRKAEKGLGTEQPPEPAANVGGEVLASDGSDPAGYTFQGGFGDF